MGKTNLGLLGRGFHTIVSPEYSLPLEESSCMFCGQCVTVCPTGALREKEPVVKRVPVKENAVESVCNFCSALCKTDLRFLGKTVMRSLPVGEQGLLCKGGRFGIFAANNQLPPVSDAKLCEIAETVKQYGDSVAVVLGPTASLEEAAFAKANFPNVYADVTEKSAAFAGVKLLGIESVSAYRGEKAAILLDVKKSAAVSASYTVELSGAYTAEASAQIFTAPFTANSGHYLKADGTVCTQRAAVKTELPTALVVLAKLCGAEVKTADEVFTELQTAYPVLANSLENGIIEKEVIRNGGGYNWNDNSTVISEFCESF